MLDKNFMMQDMQMLLRIFLICMFVNPLTVDRMMRTMLSRERLVSIKKEHQGGAVRVNCLGSLEHKA
jgi:hypothetical protein